MSHHSHLELRKMSACAKRAAHAHPSESQFSGTRGRRIEAAAAKPVAANGARKETASATSMRGPAPGTTLISSEEKRIRRNNSQTATHVARQRIDAVRNVSFAMCTGR